MDFFNTFFVTGDAGSEPVIKKAELEEDGHEFADYEKKEHSMLSSYCVVA